jgi:hypothetical protein
MLGLPSPEDLARWIELLAVSTERTAGELAEVRRLLEGTVSIERGVDELASIRCLPEDLTGKKTIVDENGEVRVVEDEQ